MKNFKSFPSKQLLIRSIATIMMFVSFALVSNIIEKNNISNCKQVILQKEKTDKKRLSSIVEKINTYIDSQGYLASNISEMSTKQVLSLIKTIKQRLDLIEQKAIKNHVEKLIDNTQIKDIKRNLETHQKTIKQS